MFFKQIMMDDAGSLSYMIGCPVARTVCVVNPKRDIHEYINTAVSNNFQITAIFETAGYMAQKSGKDKLAALSGAPVYFLKKTESPGEPVTRKGTVFLFGEAEVHIVNDPQYAAGGNAILVRDRRNPNKPWLILNRKCLYADNLGATSLSGKDLSAKLLDYLDCWEPSAATGLTDNLATLSRNMFNTSRTQIAKMSLPM